MRLINGTINVAGQVIMFDRQRILQPSTIVNRYRMNSRIRHLAPVSHIQFSRYTRMRQMVQQIQTFRVYSIN